MRTGAANTRVEAANTRVDVSGRYGETPVGVDDRTDARGRAAER
jgi:hypothetical protein